MARPTALPVPVENRLLATLPPEEYQRLLPHLEPVHVAPRQVLRWAGEPFTHVWFPRSGVLSELVILEDGTALEVATMGNEGMAGLAAVLGGGGLDQSQTFAQIAGESLRIGLQTFRDEVPQGSALHRLVQCYAQAMLAQMAQAIACNRVHPTEERLARWLLMAHDRAMVDQLPLTHQFLSQMLGVRRATVTVVAGMLQKAGLIDYGRGVITIIDRPGLEAASCECYRIMREVIDRMFV
jgi:CRP-like cAMP-binding protein